MYHYAFALQFMTCFGLCVVIVGDIFLYTTLGIAACLTFVFCVLMIQNNNVCSRLCGKNVSLKFCNV